MTSKNESGSIKTGIVALVAATALSSSMLAMADHHEEGKPEGEDVQMGADLSLANQLASYGDRNNDALALIVAASIRQGIPTTDEEGEAESQGSGEIGEEKEEGAGNGADDILARARELAGDNEELTGLIDDVAASGSRAGDVEGPGCYHDRVYAGYTDIWNITYTRGSNWVELSGDRDTDLDMYVYSGGRLLCAGDSWDDREFCSWRQYNTGNIRVEIKNLGGVYNVYDLCTN